ncbi:7-deoxyloganetic acid glucosyltransferase isoform X2 [Vigna radiata var. radiata]|uniref:Glycosyltransferase n=1 Tax=Vigna radiata var. radiata TaxID=3916 RepID=A0A1S3VMP7_VIGRR|nr:7-deoxyloganetic acid glucosyltransferase isoform X2 [Vigna radiata var. radiata]
MAEEEGEAGGHHVLLLPGPMQGNVNSMMKLAQLLALHHFHITFLTTDFIHRRLYRFADIHSLSQTYPNLEFKTISDGLPDDHPRSGNNALADLYSSMNSFAKPLLRDIILSQTAAKSKITCLIGDGFLGGLTADVADEVGIPLIHFRAISASCFWALFCAPNLFESNELPIRGEEDMDRIISNLPGMENILRCRDLPSFYRGTETNLVDPLKSTVFDCHQTLRARGVILNTFEDLDGPLLSQMRLKFLRVFAVGPLHAHAKTTPSTSSFWEEDRSCLTWLDSQPLKSVLYVSFGSIATVTRERLMEFWYGLVNSKKRFLWVIRPDMVAGEDNDERVAAELEEGTKERGFIVGWAPQEEVLAHKAIGGFLTHSGWNSTLESLVAGVPMICWPCFADQQINSRFVSEVWKVGLDMKDLCDRDVVEKMVNDLMVHRREEFLKSAQAMATLAHKSVSPGGSSYSSLHDLVEFIKSASRKIN